MLKTIKIAAFALLTMSLFTFGLCDKVADEIVVDYNGSQTFDLLATPAAGEYPVQKDKIENKLQKFLTDNKINPSKVTTLTVNKVTATLANTALKFDALESASLLIDGTQWAGGAITVDASGNVLVGGVVAGNVNNQTLTLSTPKLSVKDLLSKTTLDYKLVIKTKKATPASACTANYAITIGYSL